MSDSQDVKKRVLIVDDDPALLEIFSALLEDYTVETCVNARQAIEKLKTFQPDIILLDQLMPKFSGVECTKALLKSDKNVKIIAVNEYRHNVDEMLQAGAIDHIQKPFTKLEITEKIEKYLQ